VFDRSTATYALKVDDLDDLDNCTFISTGTDYAIDLGTVVTSVTMGWDCQDSGYAATDGSTGDETIRVVVNSGQVLTVNVASGATTPTFHVTGGGSVDVVSGQITMTVKVVDSSGTLLTNVAEITITDDSATPVVLFHVETSTSGSEGYTFDSADAGDPVVVLAVTDDYEPYSLATTLPSVDGTFTAQLSDDRTYDNPA
jgi:hypothetical protein